MEEMSKHLKTTHTDFILVDMTANTLSSKGRSWIFIVQTQKPQKQLLRAESINFLTDSVSSDKKGGWVTAKTFIPQ